MNKKEYKIGSHLILHDYEKDKDYDIWIKDINKNRPSYERYEIDIENLTEDGCSYYEVFRDYYKCGEDLLEKFQMI